MDCRKSGRNLVDALKDSNAEVKAWAKAIVESKDGVEKVPPGWFTENQLAEQLGFSLSGIRPHLRTLVKVKKAESKKFKTSNATDGRILPKTHFRLLK